MSHSPELGPQDLWSLGQLGEAHHRRGARGLVGHLCGIPLLGFRAVDLIRHGGKKMRLLVAKSDVETAKKIRFRSPPP